MRDKISIDRINKLHPKVVDEVFHTIENLEAGWPANVAIRIVQGLRTIEEQDALYAKGRTVPGPIVTKVKGGSSFHNYGLAFDFALIYDSDGNGSFEKLSWDEKDPHWQEVVSAFEAQGWYWGGNFSTIHDAPHMEKSFGKSLKDLRKAYKPGEYVIIT